MPQSMITDEELDRLLYEASPYPPEQKARLSMRAEADLERILAGEAVTPPRLARAHRRRAFAWIAPALAVVLVGVVILSVQTFLQFGAPAPAVTVTVVPPEDERDLLPPGLAATGVFVSPDGSTSGRVEVTIGDDGAMIVSILDLVSSHDVLAASASFWSREDDACQDGGGLSWGDFDPKEPASFTQPTSNDFLGGDWTAFDEIDLTVFTAAPGSQCINTIVARAPLEWTVAPLRPQLAELEDSGPSDGANGTVSLGGNGRPVAYLVAPNDRLEAVATRFGISADDIFYLNVTRLPNPRDPMLYIDEVLNLDLAQR